MTNRLEKQVKCRKNTMTSVSEFISSVAGSCPCDYMFPSLHKVKGSDGTQQVKYSAAMSWRREGGRHIKKNSRSLIWRRTFNEWTETFLQYLPKSNFIQANIFWTLFSSTSLKQTYSGHCSVLTAHSPSLDPGNYSFSCKATSYLYTQLRYMFTNVTKHKLYSCFNYR